MLIPKSPTMKKSMNKQQDYNESFRRYMLRKENLYQLILFFVLYGILYGLMIYLYPYPASISDSGAYVNAAVKDRIDTFRPFGYSRFLIIIHGLSSSIHLLVFIQYFLCAISTMFFVFTIKFLFQPRNTILYYLFALFAIFSPLVIYLTNSVLSDSLFTILTILWFTSAIWMLYCNKTLNRFIFSIINIILLILLINVRYTGLVFLPVTMLFVYLSLFRRNILICIALMITPILLVFNYYKEQKAKINKLVHVNTFSGFSGWQLANNALHIVPYIKLDPSEFKDEEVKRFAEFIVQQDTLLVLKVKPSAKFMWNNEMPLKKYHFYEMQRRNRIYLYMWNYLGENVYSKFGSHVIKTHPLLFIRYYLLPNCRLILYPTQDQIIKSFKTDGIPDDLLKKWFEFDETEKVYSRSKIFEKLFFIIPVSRLIIWIMVIAAILIYLIKRKQIKWQSWQEALFWMLWIFLAIYYAFSAYAGPFELRYIAPVHLIQVSTIYIFINSAILGIRESANNNEGMGKG